MGKKKKIVREKSARKKCHGEKIAGKKWVCYPI